MSRFIPALLATLVLVGCKKEQPPPPAGEPSAASQPAPEAPSPDDGPSPDEPSADAPPLQLNAAILDRYLKYQKRMHAAYAESMKEVKGIEEKVAAGSYKGLTGSARGVHDMAGASERIAASEKAAQEEAGLAHHEISELDSLVADVVMKRQVAKAANLDATLQQMEQMRAALPKEQQAALEQSITELRKRQEEMNSLSEERERYGSANVDLVLTKEAEFLANYQDFMKMGVKP